MAKVAESEEETVLSRLELLVVMVGELERFHAEMLGLDLLGDRLDQDVQSRSDEE